VKFRKKISLIVLTTLLFSAIIIISVNGLLSRKIIKQQVRNWLETTIRSRAIHIETLLKMDKELTRLLSESVTIEKLLRSDKMDRNYNRKLKDVIVRLDNSANINKQIYDILFLNLNGIHAMADNEVKSLIFRFSVSKDKRFVKVSIKDTGYGIAKKDFNKIFDILHH